MLWGSTNSNVGREMNLKWQEGTLLASDDSNF